MAAVRSRTRPPSPPDSDPVRPRRPKRPAPRVGALPARASRSRFAEMEAKRLAVLAKLDELRATHDESWEACKLAFELAWSDFERAFPDPTTR